MPGPRLLLYALLLLSSIVTGTAAMVPIFLLMFQLGLIDYRSGVALVLTGGLLPAAIFILKDFIDATPKSYEESARVFGASPLQILRHVVLPIARPGLATIAVWALVNAWGNFLTPSSCCATRTSSPPACSCTPSTPRAAGEPAADLDVLAAVLDPGRRAVPVRQPPYGFRFHGGIKS